jgi:hypothetical protein
MGNFTIIFFSRIIIISTFTLLSKSLPSRMVVDIELETNYIIFPSSILIDFPLRNQRAKTYP